MSIFDIERAKVMKKWGDEVGREGMYERALEVAKWMLDESRSPQEVMKGVGKMAMIATASNCDCYWSEKVHMGKSDEWYYAREHLAKPVEKTS